MMMHMNELPCASLLSLPMCAGAVLPASDPAVICWAGSEGARGVSEGPLHNPAEGPLGVEGNMRTRGGCTEMVKL